MRRSYLAHALLVLLAGAAAPNLSSASEHQQLYVAQPYLELHSGPGRGYPVFQTAVREERIEVLLRRTDWFKVRTERGVEGWASAADMEKTVLADGSPFTLTGVGDRAGFEDHTLEAGLLGGIRGGDPLISGYVGYLFNPQLGAELALGEAFGRFNDVVTGDLGGVYYPVPEWRLSPFVIAGGGVQGVESRPHALTLDNRTDPTAYIGAGVRYYLTQHFFLRAEYKARLIFTNQHEEVDEWKAGFAFFY